MTILSTLALAQALAKANDAILVVVDAYNSGGSSSWTRTFPSLDGDHLDKLGDPFAVSFENRDEAQAFFSTLCRDAAEGSGCVGGTISYVARDADSIGRFAENATVDTITFDIGDDKDYPAFSGGVVERHMILERI